MRKYGRPVDHEGDIRLVDVVEVPDNVDPEAWLDLMFRDMKEGWDSWFIPCPENACSGMSYNKGEFGEPPPSQPYVEQPSELATLLIEVKKISDKIGGVSAADQL